MNAKRGRQAFTAPPRDEPNGSFGFLREMQRRCYRYMLDATDPRTGLVADRGAADGSRFSSHASSAACGFALASHALTSRYGWTSHARVVDLVSRMLRTLLEQADHHHGFIYHFLDTNDGSRALSSEASSIDTALLVAGTMCAAVAFSDQPQIVEMADELYRRIDWGRLLGENDCLHMGWTPEQGTMPHQWDSFSELIILVLLAIGAPQNAIPPRCWRAWRREPVLRFGGSDYLSYPPLFVHQYPMAFFDFREYRSPSGRDYWRNSVIAHHAHIEFLTELARRGPQTLGHYGNDLWGVTSSDSPTGYRDWGGPYQEGRYEPDRGIDGTLVPSAAAGGLPMVPAAAVRTLRHQRRRFGDSIYGRYGFVNAFNPATGWVSRDVIGIDTGISLLMAENHLSGGVWKLFMKHPAAIRALKLSGFHPRAGW